MKTKIFSLILLIAFNSIFAQQNIFDKKVELKKFVYKGGLFEEISQNTYKLTYRDGTQRVYNFNTLANQSNNIEGFENTIINVWEIDTTLYANKFKFWQRVDIVNAYEGIVCVEDINHNGLLELYGYSEEDYPFNGPVVIFEQDTQGMFSNIFTYDSNTVFIQGIGDIDSDGKKEVHLRTNDTLNGKFYRADSISRLPTTFDFIFYYYPNQIQDEIFGDFDRNGITDCAFVDGSNPSKVIICEYRNELNNFESTFEITTEGDVPSGFAIGDFNLDGKTEIVFSTVLQKVYVIEVTGNNQYSLVWQGLAPTYNAVMICSTTDIDGNGKPEFWVGGQDFNTGISTFWCYEADDDNDYLPVAGIELRYLVTLDADYLQSADTDNDGKQELIINLGNHLLILKFSGESNQHNYEIYYAKIDELSQLGADFLPVTISDLNHDGKMDILLPMEKFVNTNTELFSYLLTQDSLTLVSDDNFNVAQRFDIIQNYPNPFNSTTQVKVILKEPSFIKISIYNLLGEEITTLLEKELSPGSYNISWEARDKNNNSLPSGIYFIKLNAGSFNKTIKAVLIK